MRWTLLATLLFSLPVWAFPVVLKIENACQNPFRLVSKSQKEEFEIPAGETREVVVLSDNNWQVGYASGMFKAFTWKLNVAVNDIVKAFKAGAENWRDDIVVVCTFTLVKENGTHKLVPKLTYITGIPSENALEALKEFTEREGIIFPEGNFSFEDLIKAT